MRRNRRSFFWMSIILEFSFIMGIGLYILVHWNGEENLGGVIQTVKADESLPPSPDVEDQQNEEKPAIAKEEPAVKKDEVEISSTDNLGGPYTVSAPLHVSIYRAKSGDNLWSIAKKNNLDFYTILSVNGLEKSNKISVGQKLKIPNQRGIIHTLRKGETLEDISLKYNVNIRKVIRVNQILDPNDIESGMELFVPDAKITNEFTKELLEKSGVYVGARGGSAFYFVFPCRQAKSTSGFGYRRDPFTGRRAFHAGVDITPGYGSAVYASMNGVVTYSGWMGGYGKLVVVTHSNGYSTRYGHLSRITVKKGTRVNQGQRIGSVGSTGRSTGPHLHFEIRKDNKALNPKKFIKIK